MSVYVDDAIWNWQGLKWAHLLADDTDELHRFALRLGIQRGRIRARPERRCRTTMSRHTSAAARSRKERSRAPGRRS